MTRQYHLQLLLALCLFACNTDSPQDQPKQPGREDTIPADSTATDSSDSQSEEEPPVPIDPFAAYNDTFTDCLHYRDFGARGDGHTNDIDAIVATHKQANEQRRCVQGDNGATYYISDITESAIIQTPTDWRGASFIIDDSKIGIDLRGMFAFQITAATPMYVAVADGINYTGQNVPTSVKRHQENIGLNLPQDSLVVIFDTNTLRYIREGANQNDGAAQQDFIVVDKNGNVSPDSPIMWDYQQITHIFVYPMDEETLPIIGGTFTTIANQAESAYNYYARGIGVTRSNVVIDGITHYVKNEMNHGAPYNGFIIMQNAANITIKNSVFTGHKTYTTIGSGGTPVSMGSYDLGPSGIINLTFENCSQTNDILDTAYWGIIGSNYCKNIIMRNCVFSRFDAHQGVIGATIIGSKLGHHGVLIIGEGLLTMKDTTVYGSSFITLRDDYGSTWNGDIKIENCTWDPYGSGLSVMPLIYGRYTGEHNFGYECYMPQHIDINGLYVHNVFPVYLLGNITPQNTSAEFSYTYPYHITKTINITGYEASAGDKWKLSQNMYMFNDVEVNEY